jgi:23S rRNA pseudouridine1911/1915/1917 synthase
VVAKGDAALRNLPAQFKGRESQTEYRVLETYDEHTLVEAHPLTGRTHQIRIHLAFIGHPIVGDPVYGFRKQRLKVPRLFLHAARLAFHLPATGEWREFHAPLPDDLAGVLTKLRNP